MFTKNILHAWPQRLKTILPSHTHPSKMQQIMEALAFEKLAVRDNKIGDFLMLIQQESIPTENFVDKCLYLFTTNKPLQQLFDKIHNQKLISEQETSQLKSWLNTHLHAAILFEALSISMLNSKTFNKDVYNFIIQLRQSILPGNPIANFFLAYGSNFNLTRNLKMVAVDPVMTYGAFYRSLDNLDHLDEVEKKSQRFINKYNLSLWNAQINPFEFERDASIKNIAINMLWAICNESPDRESSRLNAQAGCGLIALMEKLAIENKAMVKNVILPDGESLLPDNRYTLLPDLIVETQPKVVNILSFLEKEWMDLYTSWDLLFLIESFGAALLPIKLLVPSVLGAIPAHYFESRVFLLFLMGNLFQTCNVEANPLFQPGITLKNGTEIKDEWAKINLKHCG